MMIVSFVINLLCYYVINYLTKKHLFIIGRERNR